MIISLTSEHTAGPEMRGNSMTEAERIALPEKDADRHYVRDHGRARDGLSEAQPFPVTEVTKSKADEANS